jgi:alkanesulfonate monooxygenase SsuD/methylene tetrahydromethanopterin reductase-like flavin-dependent oxidoreductase (luciferase family)
VAFCSTCESDALRYRDGQPGRLCRSTRGGPPGSRGRSGRLGSLLRVGPPRLRAGRALGDPCVILSAVATSTTLLKLGLAVTPLARRRPQIVANALASLDLLSAGRVIFEVGLGGMPEEFTAFGESGRAKQRAAMFDEGLMILDGLWSGETVTHRGQHYAVEGVSGAAPTSAPSSPIQIGMRGRARLAPPSLPR